jgi:hypothetical protein
VAVAGWQWDQSIREPGAVILSGEKFEIRAFWGSGMWVNCVCAGAGAVRRDVGVRGDGQWISGWQWLGGSAGNGFGSPVRSF